MITFCISTLLIFFELALIRWIATEINVFAYLQNLPLICCFMGFGIGLLKSKTGQEMRQFLILSLSLCILIACGAYRSILSSLSVAVGALGGSFVAWNVWHYNTFSWLHVPGLLLGLLIIFCLMTSIALACLPLGAMLGACFTKDTPALKTYGLNLAGSLTGIWLFFILSANSTQPALWFLVISFLCFACILLSGNKAKLVDLALLLALPLVVHLSGRGEELTIWSPYQKLSVQIFEPNPEQPRRYWMKTNSSGYQAMLDLRPETLQAFPKFFTANLDGYTQYDLPMRFHPRAKSALLLGAGSGNDAAGALRAGLTSIQAVDIDPAIIQIGRALHPESPYSSSQVRTVNTDARAFLTNNQETFDIISFGLLDSHTTGQMTNTRLDHFVYTLEALNHAKRALKPDGVVTLTFEASKPYISDRIRNMLQDVFGHAPLVIRVPKSNYGFGGIMFITGSQESIQKALQQDPKLNKVVSDFAYDVPKLNTPATTDDWPYIYLTHPTIPLLFVCAAIFALIIFAALSRMNKISVFSIKGSTDDWYFFFLGAGFLLLEVTSISRAAIVLGSSWQPTAAIITGIMLMALLANYTAAMRSSLNIKIAGALLILACVALYFFNLETILLLPVHMRFIFTAVICCFPLFFSGLLFSWGLARTPDYQRALAMNLFGAVLGSLLHCFSLLLGLRALLVMVALFYTFAVTLRINRTSQI